MADERSGARGSTRGDADDEHAEEALQRALERKREELAGQMEQRRTGDGTPSWHTRREQEPRRRSDDEGGMR